MNTRWLGAGAGFTVLALGFGSLALLLAQDTPRFTTIQPLTNKEIALNLSISNGLAHRIDVSTNPAAWIPLVTLPGAVNSLRHTDSAAPYLQQRLYRAEQLSGTNFLTGDHLVTTNGNVVFRPLYHASFVMSWNGKMIYNDPDSTANYQGLPKADLILISHDHGDHFDGGTINAVTNLATQIVVPLYVYNNNLSVAQRAIAIVLTNGASTNVMGMKIDAIPAYNSNHPLGRGNGYVLTIGDKRIYISGDTGDVPEMRALPDIDVAFLAMNLPFTMSVSNAASAAREFRPKVVYPYHHSGNPATDLNDFKRRVGQDLGIEVRLRKWY